MPGLGIQNVHIEAEVALYRVHAPAAALVLKGSHAGIVIPDHLQQHVLGKVMQAMGYAAIHQRAQQLPFEYKHFHAGVLQCGMGGTTSMS